MTKQVNDLHFPLRYDILYFILTYMVPIVAMGVSYGHIGRVLWGRNNITGDAAACSEAHERKLASKRKVGQTRRRR